MDKINEKNFYKYFNKAYRHTQEVIFKNFPSGELPSSNIEHHFFKWCYIDVLRNQCTPKNPDFVSTNILEDIIRIINGKNNLIIDINNTSFKILCTKDMLGKECLFEYYNNEDAFKGETNISNFEVLASIVIFLYSARSFLYLRNIDF